MSQVTLMVGNVFDRLAEIPDGSIDLVATSPPFLALRSYLPDGHPDKDHEIGLERNPAEFIDTMLDLGAEYRRVLAPHGSIAIELGDTYSGAGGGGGDLLPGGIRKGAAQFADADEARDAGAAHWRQKQRSKPAKASRSRGRETVAPATGATGGDGWPLEKSACGIPHLLHIALAYGINPLTGMASPAGLWRVRNHVAWCRPNPQVGSLSDKYRPATSYMTIACLSRDRYFDLDAVRVPSAGGKVGGARERHRQGRGQTGESSPPLNTRPPYDHVGLLDGEADLFTDDAWLISPEPYRGAHYATWPKRLIDRPILSMVPQRVCTECGTPSRRIVETVSTGQNISKPGHPQGATKQVGAVKSTDVPDYAERTTVGWTDCGHDAWRRGLVLDPFGGSGTTGEVAASHGRDAILIDIDARNADLARERCGMFLDVC